MSSNGIVVGKSKETNLYEAFHQGRLIGVGVTFAMALAGACAFLGVVAR